VAWRRAACVPSLAVRLAHDAPAQLETFQDCTGRFCAPAAPSREARCVVGRRGDKSRVAALVAVYLAAFRDYRRLLAAGEIGTLPVIASDRRQARTVMGYIVSMLDACPMLAQLVTHRTSESIELSTRCRGIGNSCGSGFEGVVLPCEVAACLLRHTERAMRHLAVKRWPREAVEIRP
jgi:hypothetical protein